MRFARCKDGVKMLGCVLTVATVCLAAWIDWSFTGDMDNASLESNDVYGTPGPRS